MAARTVRNFYDHLEIVKDGATETEQLTDSVNVIKFRQKMPFTFRCRYVCDKINVLSTRVKYNSSSSIKHIVLRILL